MIHPRAHRSVKSPARLFSSSISGAQYIGVPTNVSFLFYFLVLTLWSLLKNDEASDYIANEFLLNSYGYFLLLLCELWEEASSFV